MLGLNEKLSISGLVVTVIGIAAAAVISYHIAIKSGVFDESKLELTYGNEHFNDDSDIDLFIAINNKLGYKDVVLFPLDFNLSNIGDKVVANSEMVFEYEKEYGIGSSVFDSFIRNSGVHAREDLKHETNSSDSSYFEIFRYADLNPGESPLIGSAIIASNKKKNNFEMPYFTNHQAKFTILTHGDGVREKKYRFNIVAINVNNANDLIEWYRNYYASAIAYKIRADMGFISYMFELLFNHKDKNAYLINRNYGCLLVNNDVLWLPKDNWQQVHKISFRPYSWKLLFNASE